VTEKRRQLPVWQESILLVATAMVMAIVVKTFFLQAFYIPSESTTRSWCRRSPTGVVT
jgi:signal peptidase I